MTAEECGQKLDAMANLQDGWDSYKAKAPGLLARLNAYYLCQAACDFGLSPVRVVPSAVGGVYVSFTTDRDRRDIGVELYNNDKACYVFADGGEDESIETGYVATTTVGFRTVLAAAKAYLERELDGVRRLLAEEGGQ